MSRPISRLSSRAVTIASSADVFEVIREERTNPTPSSININAISATCATSPVSPTATVSPVATISTSDPKPESEEEKETATPTIICPCKAIKDAEQKKNEAEVIERLLKEKEIEMEGKLQDRVTNEMQYLKDRFAFILQNEQLRASHMLREAHRDREEKISALKTQLECKNMAGLMYVLCAERRKSRMEILRITKEYTTYIQTLQQILEESQALILHLSRGYKTTARVNYEWQEKMKKIIKHFQNFINNFTGGPPETNQYLFNLPDLLKIKTPIEDNPQENPCEEVEASKENVPAMVPAPGETWWSNLDGEDRPFVMFGDMADFKPPQRREVLRAVKAQKTAPPKWKEYVFHDMFVKADCPNADAIKDEYMKRVRSPPSGMWATQTDKQTSSKGSDTSRRVTTASVDIRGNMGSILKIIASTNVPHSTTKSTILAARDSMEIASTTRLREKHRHTSDHGKVVLKVGNKIDSMFEEMNECIEEEQQEVDEPEIRPRDEEDMGDDTLSALGSIHNDSLHVINQHVPEPDHKIHYEKICPMEKCQKIQMDDFMSSLPAYMRASPFTHFEQTYEDYEPCTPEQLEILKQRIEEKKKKDGVAIDVVDDDPLLSWPPSVEGIAVQTSSDALSLPPCTCSIARSDTSELSQRVYNMVDLIPVKQELERINEECFFNEDIEFNRFKVIGKDDNEEKHEDRNNFGTNRLQEIRQILKKHPSLCEIFQANIRC